MTSRDCAHPTDDATQRGAQAGAGLTGQRVCDAALVAQDQCHAARSSQQGATCVARTVSANPGHLDRQAVGQGARHRTAGDGHAYQAAISVGGLLPFPGQPSR
ncbi:hypothetical protein GCM10009125_28690 [Castellaniella daejeonensis]|uniref:Uncharacterized protein n=1 Tax=Castellaniella daejeonensis TaxID=659013 RepID=A0ABP3DSJ2_9BURK